MGEVSQALGILPEFEFDGRRYKVNERSLEVEGLFELHLEATHQDRIQRHLERGTLSPLAWEFHQKNWSQMLAARLYSFGTVECTQALYATPGRKEMAYLRLADANRNAKVDRALVDRIAKDPKKWQELWAILDRADNPPAEPAPDQPPAGPAQATP